MRKIKLMFLLWPLCSLQTNAQQTLIKYLSGTDKDHTVNWDFFCTDGAKSGYWTKIPVPSNWEMQGFGGYNYGHEKNKHSEHGLYKYHFTADKNWNTKQIELVFEAVMTDVEVKLNGNPVGPIHQGGFYQFSYDITSFIKAGADNLLEVDVNKMSADSSVNHAEREGDFWVFGGIYRPVYLKILPKTFIERVAIDAKADGKLNVDVFTGNVQEGDEISAQVKTLSGNIFGKTFSATVKNVTDKLTLSQSFTSPQLWNPEFPNLYNVEISIRRKNKTLHTIHQRFGFRTVEVRKGDGIYLNNTKIILKGVDRHSAWPESGRALSRKIHLLDIGLIKDMNMNAVRMSHYPPDVDFLDLCDSLGLLVLDELTGWQKKYATPVGRKLVKELVIRDVNHPSVIFWDNGNEGGWNTDLDNDFSLYDPQQRNVLHPWNNFNNVDTKHYPTYTYIEQAADKNDILLHTEMIHGLYDGGHGAGLDDYWNLMKKNPHHAGGFLWVLADEGIIRKDKHDSIDTYGNNAPDGIVGPHREKEGSFYTIKEIWSPVQITKPVLDKNFTGMLDVQNTYLFTNLSTCKFSWQLIKYSRAMAEGAQHTVLHADKTSIQLAPGKKGSLVLSLPKNWQQADALQLKVVDKDAREIYTWIWPIKTPLEITQQNLSHGKKNNSLKKEEGKDATTIVITQDAISYTFDKRTGYLTSVVKKEKNIPFSEGPVLAGEKQSLQSFTMQEEGSKRYRINIQFTNSLKASWIFSEDEPLKLEYSYTQKDSADFYGITFNTNESKITGMKWLGGGPYRVWKNRLKGAVINVWHKKYNNTITGETFDYPEFKGYHANMYWASIENTVSPFTVYTDVPGLYLQILHPEKQKTKFNPFVNPSFPEGNLGFLNAIPPIGTKFRSAETMGPQSQKNGPAGLVSGNLWFDFR
jgi:beta-galactosidase/beta-glucuronidase